MHCLETEPLLSKTGETHTHDTICLPKCPRLAISHQCQRDVLKLLDTVESNRSLMAQRTEQTRRMGPVCYPTTGTRQSTTVVTVTGQRVRMTDSKLAVCKKQALREVIWGLLGAQRRQRAPVEGQLWECDGSVSQPDTPSCFIIHTQIEPRLSTQKDSCVWNVWLGSHTHRDAAQSIMGMLL